MEEDMFYNHIMTAPQRRPSQPPPYRAGSPDHDRRPRTGSRSPRDPKDKQATLSVPRYQSTLNIEGVFSKKHEIENTTKRAEDRHWHPVFVALQGTALNVYGVKKDWGWGKTRDGPTISPDNPPWVRKGKLEKSYSLLHADAGIAADYNKRRYVIRVRAETDQFLLSCVELSTFVKWLESLFAAIDVAAPIDDRDFPRDMSIPRVQRIRWFQGQSPALPGFAAAPTTQEPDSQQSPAQDPVPSTPAQSQSQSIPQPPESGLAVEGQGPSPSQPRPLAPGHAQPEQQAQSRDASGGPPRFGPPRRFSMTTYPNLSVDPHTGKWFPEHKWSSAHDLLYAKLCYSNLLFRSPRKSNYIISKGKQWFVDWGTGRMVRVLPPTYGEVDYFGPWQVIHTENFRI
ncbi:pleckstrin-like domain-containing protein [Hirsutella rhossiliensis]|uniref:Pleckstrin-like domain-containing protein n=1 Tax=Hirsutella rhossiliensis TaxID=111463 RepID=A0A9P8SK23_9HYPO|nr:pleckstrin-like domain-containing protein [Hirsutella rhossiliensis]KAH0965898.1 pleckstrin-like domain-containing protein [Hirsutella rhossiliensis]